MDVRFIRPSIVTMPGVFVSVFLIVVIVNDGLRCAGFRPVWNAMPGLMRHVGQCSRLNSRCSVARRLRWAAGGA